MMTMDITRLCVFTCFLIICSFGYNHPPIDMFRETQASIHIPETLPPPLMDLIVSLDNLQRKPTCYRRAATSLIEHCKLLTSDIPDDERVHFAIKLTACELDLIQQTPLHCREDSRWKDCVKALASKDHWWTTFSGNLREVTNVCWVGQQEVEKGLYKPHDVPEL
jgi:Tht1-like nuclear fusion protein